jgi:hypothetical protein
MNKWLFLYSLASLALGLGVFAKATTAPVAEPVAQIRPADSQSLSAPYQNSVCSESPRREPAPLIVASE